MSSDKFLIHTKQSLSTGVSYTDAEVSFIKVKKEKKMFQFERRGNKLNLT